MPIKLSNNNKLSRVLPCNSGKQISSAPDTLRAALAKSSCSGAGTNSACINRNCEARLLKRIINISNGNFKTFKPLLASGVMLLLAIFSVTLNALPTLASSITLSVTSSSESLNLLPTAGAPAFGKSGTITATLSTDSASGYTFTVAGPDDNKELTGTNSSNKISSITSAISESTFSNASNTTYNNKWGFLPSKLDGNTNTNYQPGPGKTTPTTIDVTTSANGTANTYTFAIAAKVDNSQAKDEYSTTLNLLASANATQYSIGYVDLTNNMPTTTAGSTTDTTVQLSTQTPTKSGYVFKGWCSIATTSDTCTGTTYQPGASYNLSNGAITNLYAMWKEIDCTIMQNMGDYCKTKLLTTTLANTDSTITMTDSRDGKTYTVGKLADGKIWLLDNLAFDGTSGNGTSYITMNSTNTNITGTATWSSGVIGKSLSYDSAYIDVSIKNNVIGTATLTGESGWKYGVLYNYAAATVGTVTGNPNDTDATQDICPAGWRMPTGGSSGEYQALATAYSSSVTSVRNALHLPLSGYFYNGSLANQGSNGGFWSSTASDTTGRYLLYVGASNLYPQDNNDRQHGLSVRCVAK